jgi:toxin secretion/phage lysis holin
MLAYLQHPYISPKMLAFLLLCAWATAPFVLLFEKFIFNDWQFAAFVVVAVGVDTLTGIAKALKLGKFNSSKLGKGVLAKLIGYGAALIIVHVILNAPVRGSENEVIGTIVPWLDAVVYSFILIREAISVVENLGAFGIRPLPKWLLARFQQWDEKGNWTGKPDDSQKS